MKVRVTNIQRFSLNDGPGIRTTVFFKGCGLKCPWCSNPENINYEIENYYNEDTNEKGVFGYDITLDDLEKEILKDQKYYTLNSGGVTFSGGEALLQFTKMEPLLKKLKQNKINMCIETSLFAPIKALEVATKYINEFIVDIKILDSDICSDVLKGNLDIYFKNVDYLFKNFNGKIMFRIPITKEYTLKKKTFKNTIEFIKKYKPDRIEIFKIHNLGDSKYKSLNRKVTHYEEITDEEMKKIVEQFNDNDINVVECKI